MTTMTMYKDSLDPSNNLPSNWTGVDLLNWLKFEDSISPPIRRLLPFDDPKVPGLSWEGLQTWEELMFVYINKDLWGFEKHA